MAKRLTAEEMKQIRPKVQAAVVADIEDKTLNRSDADIGREFGVSARTVGRIRAGVIEERAKAEAEAAAAAKKAPAAKKKGTKKKQTAKTGTRGEKAKKVLAWIKSNPDGSVAKCAEACGCSTAFVYHVRRQTGQGSPPRTTHTEHVFAHLRANPEATARQCAEAVGCSLPLAHRARRRWLNDQ